MQTEAPFAAFVDRDGVINADFGHVHRIEDFNLLPGAVKGLRLLVSKGYQPVVVTNQAGIAKGLYTEADYLVLTQHMVKMLAARGAIVRAVYHCPHHPDGAVQQYAITCTCRKPGPGLLLQAAREHQFDLTNSVMIGDKISDVMAGRAAGVGQTVLVASGYGRHHDALHHADHHAADLSAAAQWVRPAPNFAISEKQ